MGASAATAAAAAAIAATSTAMHGQVSATPLVIFQLILLGLGAVVGLGTCIWVIISMIRKD